jgi:ssDNA-binding Zn-finger/Zn-ribbon topoisomerase 1
MKTLDEYNWEVHNRRKEKEEFKAGVKCNKCETEMLLDNPNMMLMSYPPQQSVVCPNCGYRGYITR